MLVLALDTATPTLVAGLADWSQHGVTEVLAERAVPSGTRHAELLTPAISSVLDDAGLTMGDLDAVVSPASSSTLVIAGVSSSACRVPDGTARSARTSVAPCCDQSARPATSVGVAVSRARTSTSDHVTESL